MHTKKTTYQRIGTALFFGGLGFLLILPLMLLFLRSFSTESSSIFLNYVSLLAEPRTVSAIKNTIIIGIGATIISVGLGGILAFLMAYTNIKRKKLIQTMIMAQFIIPSYVITLAWSQLFQKTGVINQFLEKIRLPMVDIYTIGGIVFVLGLCNLPLVYTLTLSMFRKVPRDLEWAGRISGCTQWQTMIKINLPQVLPALIGGGILAFLAALDNFSVPAFLGISSGIPVLSTYIYEKAISFGPSAFTQAATLAVMLAIISMVGTIIQGRLIKKSSGMDRIKEDFSERILFTKTKRRILEWTIISVLGMITVIPLVSMMISSVQKYYGASFEIKNFTFSAFEFVFTNAAVASAVKNSIVFAGVACLICVFLGTAIGYLKARNNALSVKLVELGATLNYAVPGIVLALAMIFCFGKFPNVYNTSKIIIIAYVFRYLIIQIKGSATAVLTVEASLEEAALISGTGIIRRWTDVLIPLIRQPILMSSFFIFNSALTELTLSSMLSAAGTKTIGLTIFNLQQAGSYNLAATMSTVLVLLILAGYLLIWMMQRASRKKAAKQVAAEKVLTKIINPCLEE